MNSIVALLTAALAAQAGPTTSTPAPAPAGEPQPVQVEAGSITYDAATERYDLREKVVLRRGEVTVRAPAARYDPKTGEVNATGGVLLLERGRVISADGIHAIIDGPYQAQKVVAFFKDQPLELQQVKSIEEGRHTGRNKVTLCGKRVDGEVQGDRFTVDSAEISLCDCGDAPPSWEIKAKSADVIPGDRAILSWPIIHITPRFLFLNSEEAEKQGLLKPIPILPLPWLYVPLADRKTGLLFPQLGYTQITGWTISQPLFITLGRSWDATVTADHAFGRNEGEVRSGQRGVRGPGGSFELRWAPVVGAAGAFRLRYLQDLERDWAAGQPSEPHGGRLELSLRHAQRFSDSTFFSTELALVNDPNYVADFTGDVLLRKASYGRSAITLTYRKEDWLLEGDAAYHNPQGGAQSAYGLFGSDVPVFHRLPSASATLLPVRLAGPLFFSGSAGVARFGPMHGTSGNGGNWQSGERLAATRLATRVELGAPLALGRYLTVEPWVRSSFLGYSYAAAKDPQLNGRVTGGVNWSTQLSRTYGEGPSRIRHVVEPRAEWAWGGLESGSPLPAYAYDEWDAPRAFPSQDPNQTSALPRFPLSAMPPGGFQQLRVYLRNRLIVPSGSLSQTWVDLDLGQDFDLRAGNRSESWGRTRFGWGPVTGDALARFYAFGAQAPAGTPTPPPGKDSWLDKFTELRLNLNLADTRGDDVHVSFSSQAYGGSPQTKAGMDTLFDPRPIAFDAIALASPGVHAKLSGLDCSYDVKIEGRNGKILEHLVTAKWISPCNCWTLGLTFRIVPEQGMTGFQLLFDLSQFANSTRFAP